MANICKKATIRIVVALLLAAYDNSYKKETNNALGNGKTQHLRGTKLWGRSGTLPPSPGKWFLKNKFLSQLRVNRTSICCLRATSAAATSSRPCCRS